MAERFPHPSARDVARLAKVSQSAVSRAFRQGASISDAMRDKIIKAAGELGYRPNLIARSLISGKSDMIGVVIGTNRFGYVRSTLEALSEGLSEVGKLMLVHTAAGNTSVDVLVGNFLEFRVDALLLLGATMSPQLADQCYQRQVPVISFRAARDIPGFSSVSADNLVGGETIGAHLLHQGYRNPAFMAGQEDSLSSRERERGFVNYLTSQGLQPPERVSGHFDRDHAIEATRVLLSRRIRPDAIFCADDQMAMAAIEIARFEYGVEIGRELGIAGFDNISQAAWPSFDLTTYTVPMDIVIERVMAILREEPDANPPQVTIEGELKIRGSTRRN